MYTRMLIAVIAMFIAVGCEESVTVSESSTHHIRVAADRIVVDPLAPVPGQALKLYKNAEREELGNGIGHYQFEVDLGPGKFDVVRIHRVVREHTPGRGPAPARPVRTDGAVFMAHGAALSFEAIFLKAGTENPDAQTSLAVFLAANNIDVWGMDFAWGLVPRATTNFDFMRHWGIERDVDHILAAMSIARFIRRTTRQGSSRMHLLGYSSGAAVAYGAAGRETQQDPARRDIRGIVPVELALKFASPADALPYAPCEAATNGRETLESKQTIRRSASSSASSAGSRQEIPMVHRRSSPGSRTSRRGSSSAPTHS